MLENKEVRNLELCDIAPYLPYQVKIRLSIGEDYTMVASPQRDNEIGINTVVGSTFHKPLLHPLSDYTDINGKAMRDLNTDIVIQLEISQLAYKHIGYWSCSYGAIEIMAKHHIDFKRLIDSGLAIPIHNTK